MHFAFLQSDIRLFSSEHSFTSVGRGIGITQSAWQGFIYVFFCSLTNAGHAGQVQGVAVEAVAGVALLHPNTSTVLTSVQYPTLLGSQTLEGFVLICGKEMQQISMPNREPKENRRDYIPLVACGGTAGVCTKINLKNEELPIEYGTLDIRVPLL